MYITSLSFADNGYNFYFLMSGSVNSYLIFGLIYYNGGAISNAIEISAGIMQQSLSNTLLHVSDSEIYLAI